ncbi:MAG: HAD family hydrolase [Clostridia bacterium]|nr:HAD family hydrolase [Clostridia bacterium]
MIKNVFFDMDGTLIDCNPSTFLPPYKNLLLKKFSYRADGADLVKTIFEGVVAMLKNDGAQTNRDVFFRFIDNSGIIRSADLEDTMGDFYETAYDELISLVGKKTIMPQAVELLIKKGYRLAVTTNPLFPLLAIEKRLIWGGHNPKNFELVTSYETSSFAKPSVGFFIEALNRLDFKTEETLVVGNDKREDIHAGKEVGMTAYYLTDTPIDDGSGKFTPDFEGKENEFYEFVKNLPALK